MLRLYKMPILMILRHCATRLTQDNEPLYFAI
jgi:hypothetical protein